MKQTTFPALVGLTVYWGGGQANNKINEQSISMVNDDGRFEDRESWERPLQRSGGLMEQVTW